MKIINNAILKDKYDVIVIGAGILIYFISETKSKLEMKKEETAPSGEKKPE